MNKALLYAIFLPLLPSCNVRKELVAMSYNIHNAAGMDAVTDYKRIAAVIALANADVAAIQEVDSATHRSKGAFVLAEIAKHARMHLSFSASIPFEGGKYGVGILSKEKPVATKSVALPGSEEARSLLIAEFKDFVVCCTHFSLNEEDRLLSIPIISEHTKDYREPVFLAGDLNDLPSSATMKELQKSWAILSDTTQGTFSSSHPQMCIDYILARKVDSVKAVNSAVINEATASDHLPVVATSRYEYFGK
jgi:endonuclease/exonuclease/phosphatase family metal-dependent hydrolase